MNCTRTPGLCRLPRLWTRRSRKRRTCRLWVGRCAGPVTWWRGNQAACPVTWWRGNQAACATPEARRYATPEGTLYLFACVESRM